MIESKGIVLQNFKHMNIKELLESLLKRDEKFFLDIPIFTGVQIIWDIYLEEKE